MIEWILTKLLHLNCWDMEKNWLDFDDLDPIFKVTLRLRLVDNGLSAPCLLKKWVDFDQTCKLYFCDMHRNWLYFSDLHSIFKVRLGLRLLVNGLSALYRRTCTSILLWHGKELVRFWWPWPHFQVTLGLRLLENCCISWRNGWILNKLAQQNCCGMENN